MNNDRESDSSLSDQADSEAETERLHISPQKQRPRMIDHSAQNLPSLLITGNSLVNEASSVIDDTGNDLSPETNVRSGYRKRKRDDKYAANVLLPPEDLVDKSVVALPPKKKHQIPMVGDGVAQSSAERNEEKLEVSGYTRSTKLLEKSKLLMDPSILHFATEPTRVRADKLNMDMTSTLAKDRSLHNHGMTYGLENSDINEMFREDDEDAERTIKKKHAMEDLAEIERIFAKLKDSIYNEKLRRVEIEMKLLREGTHPEYVAQKTCVDQRLHDKIRLADAQYKYAMKSLEIATHVNRAQIHSQYYQQTRQLREETLYACSELSHHIQRERRAGDSLVPDFTFRIPDRQSTRIKQRMQCNWEVQILGAVQKHIGFPAAPEVCGASNEEKFEDFEELGLSSCGAIHRAPSLNILRLNGHHNGATLSQWTQGRSSTSPPANSGQLTHGQSHIHRHHHHHHRPHLHGNQPTIQRHHDQSASRQYPVSRFSHMNSNSLPSPVLPFVSLLQPSENHVKVESPVIQTTLSSSKGSDVFAGSTPQPYSSLHEISALQ